MTTSSASFTSITSARTFVSPGSSGFQNRTRSRFAPAASSLARAAQRLLVGRVDDATTLRRFSCEEVAEQALADAGKTGDQRNHRTWDSFSPEPLNRLATEL